MGQSSSSSIDPKLLKPSGKFSNTEWEENTVKRLILSKKLCPFYPSNENKTSDNDECPICKIKLFIFLGMYYFKGGLNHLTCCGKLLCTGNYF